MFLSDFIWTNLGSSSPTTLQQNFWGLGWKPRTASGEVPSRFLSSQRYSIKKTYWVSQKGIVINQYCNTFLQLTTAGRHVLAN